MREEEEDDAEGEATGLERTDVAVVDDFVAVVAVVDDSVVAAVVGEGDWSKPQQLSILRTR